MATLAHWLRATKRNLVTLGIEFVLLSLMNHIKTLLYLTNYLKEISHDSLFRYGSCNRHMRLTVTIVTIDGCE